MNSDENMKRDYNGRLILVGDRINIGNCDFGVVIEIRQQPHPDVRCVIGIRWDHDINATNPDWHYADDLTVDKVPEQQIQNLFASFNRGEIFGRLGEVFLSANCLGNSVLYLEKCPGKAAKMICEQYA